MLRRQCTLFLPARRVGERKKMFQSTWREFQFFYFFILAGPEKGNYTSWANVVTTPYTSKCSLTAPRQPIISLFCLVEMNRSQMLGISSIPSWKGVNQIVLACLCKKKKNKWRGPHKKSGVSTNQRNDDAIETFDKKGRRSRRNANVYSGYRTSSVTRAFVTRRA